MAVFERVHALIAFVILTGITLSIFHTFIKTKERVKAKERDN